MTQLFFMKGCTVWGRGRRPDTLKGSTAEDVTKPLKSGHHMANLTWGGGCCGAAGIAITSSRRIIMKFILWTLYNHHPNRTRPNNLIEVSEWSNHFGGWAGEMLSWECNPVLDHLKEGPRPMLSIFGNWGKILTISELQFPYVNLRGGTKTRHKSLAAYWHPLSSSSYVVTITALYSQNTTWIQAGTPPNPTPMYVWV